MLNVYFDKTCVCIHIVDSFIFKSNQLTDNNHDRSNNHTKLVYVTILVNCYVCCLPSESIEKFTATAARFVYN